MVTSNLGSLGFNPFSAVAKAVTTTVKTGARVATDPRFQAVATAAGTVYAPQQTAQVQRYASQIQSQIQRAKGIMQPVAQPARGMPMQPMMQPYGDDDLPASGGPVQRGNFMWIAAIAGAGLVLLLVLRK